MSNKILFKTDQVRQLQSRIREISEDTNQIRTMLLGQAGNWDSGLSSYSVYNQMVQAQHLINRLTEEAENLTGFLQKAISGVEDTQQSSQLKPMDLQFPALSGLLARTHSGTPLFGWGVIPPSAAKYHNSVVTSVNAGTSNNRRKLDALDEDKVVKKWLDKLKNGTPAEKKEAMAKLQAIYEARNTIARAQVAHAIYTQFGNQDLADLAHQEAERQRQKLRDLGVDEKYYNNQVDLKTSYQGDPLLACSYHPLLSGKKNGKWILVPMPKDTHQLSMLSLAMQPDKNGVWARQQAGTDLTAPVAAAVAAMTGTAAKGNETAASSKGRKNPKDDPKLAAALYYVENKSVYADIIKFALDEIGRAQVAYDEYISSHRSDLAAAVHTYADEQRSKLSVLGVPEIILDPRVNYRSRYTGVEPAGSYDPSQAGFVLRDNANRGKKDPYSEILIHKIAYGQGDHAARDKAQSWYSKLPPAERLAVSQMNADQLLAKLQDMKAISPEQQATSQELADAQKGWQFARLNLDVEGMNKYQAIADKLRTEKHATETVESYQFQIDMNAYFITKIDYHNAILDMDYQKMAAAARILQETEKRYDLKVPFAIDIYNMQVIEAKKARAEGLAMQEQGKVKLSEQRSNEAREHTQGDPRLKDAIIANRWTAYDEAQKTLIDTKLKHWDHYFAGNQAEMARLHTLADNLRARAGSVGLTLIEDTLNNQSNRVIANSKIQWYQALAMGDFDKLAELLEDKDGILANAYAHGTISRNQTTKLDEYNQKILSKNAELNKAIAEIQSKSDIERLMRERDALISQGKSIFGEEAIVDTFKVNEINAQLKSVKLDYWAEVKIIITQGGSLDEVNRRFGELGAKLREQGKQTISITTLDPITKMTRVENKTFQLEGLIDDNKVVFQVDTANRTILNARELLTQALERDDYQAAMKQLLMIYKATESLQGVPRASIIELTPQDGISQEKIDRLLYHVKAQWWDGEVNFNSQLQQDAEGMGKILKINMHANPRAPFIIQMEENNRKAIEYRANYWQAAYLVDIEEMGRQLRLLESLPAAYTTISRTIGNTVMDEVNHAILSGTLRWWAASGNQEEQNKIKAELDQNWRSKAQQAKATNMILMKDASGRTIIAAADQDNFFDSPSLDDDMAKLVGFKSNWWPLEAKLKYGTYTELGGVSAKSQRESDQKRIDDIEKEAKKIKTSLIELQNMQGIKAKLPEFVVDKQSQKVFDAIPQIQNMVKSGDYAVAQRLYDQSKALLAQGASLDIGNIMARPIAPVTASVQNIGYDTSGMNNPNNNDIYKHAKKMFDSINYMNLDDFGDELKRFSENYAKNKEVYERIAEKTGVPPQLIAAFHYRENTSMSFSVYLHNGQKLGTPTTIKPKGRIFNNFEDAAVDAILIKKDNIKSLNLTAKSNDLIAMLALAEYYNGLGNYNNGRISSYPYSGTNIYKEGKYKSDGNFAPKLVDQQPGVYLLLMSLQFSISPVSKPPVVNVNNNSQQVSGVKFESNVSSALDAINQNTLLKEGSVTIANLQNFPLYKQSDSRYASERIGSDSMAQSGCLTTALAAVNAWKTFGQWKDGVEPHPGRYNDSLGYDKNGNLYWGTAKISKPKGANYKYDDAEFKSKVKDAVDRGHPVLFAVDSDSHWMIAIGYNKDGDVIVHDTANGTLGTFDQLNSKRTKKYKTISRFYEFS